MTRMCGWAPRGRKLLARVPQGHWRTLTFLAALRHDRIDAPCVIDGPINGESFLTYVEQVLVPTLRPGDIVIIDNLGSHKGKAVRRAIRAVGARLFFLRPTVPTSIRSSRSLPSSSSCFARLPNAPSRPPGDASAHSCRPSARRNAPTTSKMPDTLQSEWISALSAPAWESERDGVPDTIRTCGLHFRSNDGCQNLQPGLKLEWRCGPDSKPARMGLAHRAITPLPSRHHLGPLLAVCPSTPPQPIAFTFSASHQARRRSRARRSLEVAIADVPCYKR